MTSVSVVIPNWNRRQLLTRVLGQLTLQTHPIAEVIVVDNGSTDGSPEAAEALGATVLRLDSNRGFAPAVNAGVRQARSESILILNNDVELPPAWLATLIAALDRSPEAWFATGKLLQPGSQTLDATFDLYSRSGCAWRVGHGRPDCDASSQPQTVPMVAFTAALFRRQLFERIGLLDERFESYLEDVDFGVRCALAGCQGLYVPQAVGFHLGSATLGVWHPDTVRRISRNQLLLVAKHFPRNWALPYGWPVLVGQLLWGIVAARHGTFRPYLKGKVEGLRLWPAVRSSGSDPERFGEFVERSEHQIRELQQKTGFDRYWRVYFALT